MHCWRTGRRCILGSRTSGEIATEHNAAPDQLVKLLQQMNGDRVLLGLVEPLKDFPLECSLNKAIAVAWSSASERVALAIGCRTR